MSSPLFEKDLAIVLRAVRYQERDLMVTAITENHGVLTGLARNGIQSRRFGSCLQLFSASLWSYKKRNTEGHSIVQLQEASLKKSFAKMSERYECLSLGSFFSEILLKGLPSGIPSPTLFRIHAHALTLLETRDMSRTSSQVLLASFYLWRVLGCLGSEPELMRCCLCQKKWDFQNSAFQAVHPAPEAGGLSCPTCSQGFSDSPIPLSSLEEFSQIQPLSLPEAAVLIESSQTFQGPLLSFLLQTLVFHVPGFDRSPLKTARFLELGKRTLENL